MPDAAVRLSLTEDEGDVEPTFHADLRGEARWDSLTLWTMVVAGVLLIVDHSAWAYFGLVGSGMYIYFSGRGIFARLEMRRRDLRIGSAGSVNQAIAALGIWGVMGLVTMVAAINTLAQT